ncbi:zf-CCHC domain-containing protein [Tanacetum coccineum]
MNNLLPLKKNLLIVVLLDLTLLLLVLKLLMKVSIVRTMLGSFLGLNILNGDLSSLALDELIGNLKVHEVVMEKDSEIYRGKKERVKSIALKAKKESSDDETSTFGSDDEEYAMVVRQPREENKSFRQRDEKKGKSDLKCFRCGDPNHLIGDCPKPSRNKDQKAFIGGSWSDNENDAKDKTNDETCLMAQSSNEVTLNSSHYSNDASSLDNDSIQIEYDSLCEISLKIINKNKILKTKRDLLEKEILKLNEKIKKLERSKEIETACKSYEELKSENAKLKETQVKFVKFDKRASSLREMLNNQKSPSCKIGLGFDNSKASTSGTKNMSFVGSSAKKAIDESTIKVHGSTLPRSVVIHVAMSSASSAVIYTSVYTDSKRGRPVAPPSPDYIPGLEEPQTPPAPQDEDEREPMFIQPQDPDYVPKPIYPEYIPLEDEHVFPVKEQPLPPVDSPTAESPGMVRLTIPWNGGNDGDDDDGDSSGDDADDEDEDEDNDEEEEHLALVDSAVVVPTVEPISPHEGTKPVIPRPSTDIATTGARITVQLQASISLPPEAEVERLLAMPTPSPSPPISLSPPSTGERLARCTAPSTHSSPPLVPSPLLPSSGCPTQTQTLRIASTQALIDAVTAALPSPPLPPLPLSLYIPPPVDRRDDVPESELPPRKRLCLSTLGPRYEIGESFTARPIRGRGIDYGFVSTVDAEARR